MKAIKLFLVVPVLATLLPVVAHAAPINDRQHDQQKLIAAGLHNGSLTPRETIGLEERERWIRQTEAHDRRTGHHLTEAERRSLEHRLNSTSHAIYDQKHDCQHR